MYEKRVLMVLNVSLAFMAFLLLLAFFDVTVPNFGEVVYRLDQHTPLCVLVLPEEHHKMSDLPRCCLEARRQVLCQWKVEETVFGETQWECRASGSEIGYLLNSKGYHYCTQQPYWP
ncbi:hypothetical protein J4421_00980 [Candidatus Woesearchaeota archaeon]|nr:hypothetical protein [Candidatus Woesearchaeota archaeon]